MSAVFLAMAAVIILGGAAVSAATVMTVKIGNGAEIEKSSPDKGWNEAIAASDEDTKVTVKLLADWRANRKTLATSCGFGEGVGFLDGAIYIPAGKNIVLDLNGKTLNRNIGGKEENASVIINRGNLEIKGNAANPSTKGIIMNGFGYKGGGIRADGKVTLSVSDVLIKNNRAQDFGAGIAVTNGATVTVTNCEIIDNYILTPNENKTANPGGGIYCDRNSKLIVGGTTNITNNASYYYNTFSGDSSFVYSNVEAYDDGAVGISKTAPLKSGALIGFASYYPHQDITGQNSSDYSKYFTPDDKKLMIYNDAKNVIKIAEKAMEVTVDEVTTPYYDHAMGWSAALTASDEDTPASVKLCKDWNADTENRSFGSGTGFFAGAINISTKRNIILDLNGYTINRMLSAAGGRVIANYGTLTVVNSSIERKGKITGGYSESYGGGIYNVGNLTIKSGVITGNRAAKGGGVYNAANSTIAISGNPEIIKNTNIDSGKDENVYLSDGVEIKLSEYYKYGDANIGFTTEKLPSAGKPVQITTSGDADCSRYFKSDKENYLLYADQYHAVKLSTQDKVMELTVGEDKYNYYEHELGWYSAVNQSQQSYVKLIESWNADSTTHSFGRGDVSTSGFWNGAICVPSNKSVILDLNGKDINRGLTTSDGSVIMNYGKLEIRNSVASQGRITGGYTKNYGGGIYSRKALTLTGGMITGNRTDGAGGGVYVLKDSKFTVGGNAVVSFNSNTKTQTQDNVYLPGETVITASSDTPLKSGASIGVTTGIRPSIATTVAITGQNTGNLSSYFTSDNISFSVVNELNILKLKSNGEVVSGDLNGDGRVTVSDIVMMKQVIAAGGPNGITGCNAAAADVDGNNLYTVNDIITIKQIKAGV